jgi:colicin import membrane protein
MRPQVGQRGGRPGFEMTQAVFFSFFLHAAVLAAALFLYSAMGTRIHVPPFYDVKLVGLPAEPAAEPPRETPPVPQPEPPRAKPKSKPVKAPHKPAAKKDTMPEFELKKTQAPPREGKPETPQAPIEAKPSGKPVAVAVSTATGEDFKFPPYLAMVRDKIVASWNPPPGLKGVLSKVQFTVHRSGRVGETKLIASSGNFYFDQAAMRAIMTASPLPPMPEEFFRDYAVFTVDMMERD